MVKEAITSINIVSLNSLHIGQSQCPVLALVLGDINASVNTIRTNAGSINEAGICRSDSDVKQTSSLRKKCITLESIAIGRMANQIGDILADVNLAFDRCNDRIVTSDFHFISTTFNNSAPQRTIIIFQAIAGGSQQLIASNYGKVVNI